MENHFQSINNYFNTRFDILEDLILNWIPIEVKDDEDADFISIKCASKILNLKPSTIYNKVYKKEIPHFKNGKHLHFRKDDLLNYIKKGKKPTNFEIEEEVNELLSQQKKKDLARESDQITLAESVKRSTKTADLADQSIEEASLEAGEIFFKRNEEELDIDFEK